MIHVSDLPSPRMAIIVTRRRWDDALNAIPRPMKARSVAETGLRAGIRITPIFRGITTDKRLAARRRVLYPLARFVGGHDVPRRREGASPTDRAHDDDAQLASERCRIYGEREVARRPQRQDPSRQRRESGRGRLSDLGTAWNGRRRLRATRRSRRRTAENPPMKVRAAMTAFRRPLWAVMVPNAGGRVLWTAPR